MPHQSWGLSIEAASALTWPPADLASLEAIGARSRADPA
jgi:hypothetical protein